MACLKALTETDDSPVDVPRPSGDIRSYRTFDCPACGFPICEWTDCPECEWYNEEIWDVTAAYHGFDD